MEITDGGYKLHVYKWDKVQSPKGVVQIIQGINENGERYDFLAQALNIGGYIVYTHDGYGQGLSRNSENQTVVFGDNGFQDLVGGVYAVRKRIHLENKTLPIYAIGHSLGGALLRYILIEDVVEYEKAVISGSGLTNQRGIANAILLAEFLQFFGPSKPSKYFDKRFRKVQYKIVKYVDINHYIEWMNRDKIQNEIDKKDPYLFIPLSISSYLEIMKLLQFVNHEKYKKHTNPTVKILLLSGTHDPSTNFGKDTIKLKDFYYRMGIYSVLKEYPEARHDLFNETNREEVFSDVLEFLNNSH
jgi:alpha-beta hydrolase superfamily lysophospholipase